jgi:hypothetical protein
VPGGKGVGICVSQKHALLIVSVAGLDRLDMYSLADWSLVRSVGSKGRKKGQFHFDCGGPCISPDGDSVLVAEVYNNRVQQLQIVDGSWVRFVGEDVLRSPQYVDCNTDVIVASEFGPGRISVLAWVDGSVLARFGSRDSDLVPLSGPRSLRLLADGSGVVVVDCCNHRLCVFALSGESVTVVGSREQGLEFPFDVLECASDGSFLVANYGGNNLIHLSRDGAEVGISGEFVEPVALVALPDGGLVVRKDQCVCFQVCRGFELRKTWISVCVTLAARGWGADGTT